MTPDSMNAAFEPDAGWLTPLGTDWPHPNMRSHMPRRRRTGRPHPADRDHQLPAHRLLVGNPARLYW